MFFSNYRLQKTWLDKCLKSPVSEDPSTSDMVNGQNAVSVRGPAPLPYSLITVIAIQLEKIYV